MERLELWGIRRILWFSVVVLSFLLTNICEILDQNTNYFTVVLYMLRIFIFWFYVYVYFLIKYNLKP